MTIGAIGRLLLGLASILAVVGVVLVLLDRFGVGRLPGDLVWRRGPVTVYLPLGLMLFVSVILTILLNLFFRR